MTDANGTNHQTPPAAITCRLCGKNADFAFQKRIMQSLDVRYYHCPGCESLQTEPPYWLDRAYADGRRITDTAAADRPLYTQLICWYLARLLPLSREDPVLDWGGGDGLTTRLLRDVGLNAFHFDSYAENCYAQGFEGSPNRPYHMIIAMEVWEHFAEPGEEIAKIFAHHPRVVYVSTGRYESQGSDWEYLAPHAGRHVFLYSEKALRWVAERYGYDIVLGPGSVVFLAQPISGWKRLIIRKLLSRGRAAYCLGICFTALRRRRHSRIKSDKQMMLELVQRPQSDQGSNQPETTGEPRNT